MQGWVCYGTVHTNFKRYLHKTFLLCYAAEQKSCSWRQTVCTFRQSRCNTIWPLTFQFPSLGLLRTWSMALEAIFSINFMTSEETWLFTVAMCCSTLCVYCIWCHLWSCPQTAQAPPSEYISTINLIWRLLRAKFRCFYTTLLGLTFYPWE